MEGVVEADEICLFESCLVTGLPKEWQQTLQDNGVSRQEQEKNPEAVSTTLSHTPPPFHLN